MLADCRVGRLSVGGLSFGGLSFGKLSYLLDCRVGGLSEYDYNYLMCIVYLAVATDGFPSSS